MVRTHRLNPEGDVPTMAYDMLFNGIAGISTLSLGVYLQNQNHTNQALPL